MLCFQFYYETEIVKIFFMLKPFYVPWQNLTPFLLNSLHAAVGLVKMFIINFKISENMYYICSLNIYFIY